MPIRVLPPEIASRIAAGEVVERPASAVKELIENSLDAAADEIRIEVREGGRRLLRVGDNGQGIPAAEVPLAFERHATSKLTSADDLEHIGTLGFRGEALASIASVAQVTLLTRHADEAAGTLARVDGGLWVASEPKGAPAGTTVTVENLFYNVPARLKFLRQPATEAAHIAAMVHRFAMAFPERRFSLLSEGRLAFQSTGTGRLLDVLIKLLGLEAARQLVPVGLEDVGIPEASAAAALPHVHGYVGLPSLHRSNRNQIFLFLNRRPIQDRTLAFAVTEAYRNRLMVGRYPVAVLLIEIDPALVDVNVHPAKAEVRFRDERAVFRAVQKAVHAALVDIAPVAELRHDRLQWQMPDWADRRQALLDAGRPSPFALQPAPGPQATPAGPAEAEAGEHAHSWFSPPEPAPANGHPPAPPQPASPASPQVTSMLPILRVVGQLGTMYIVAEGPDGMVLIDQHAAHERILFEQMMAAQAGLGVAQQTMLEPLVFEPGSLMAGLVAENAEALAAVGFALEPFGGDSWLVRGVPAVFGATDPRRAVEETLEGIADGRDVAGETREAALVAIICKRAAVKAGQVLSMPEMRHLLRQLESCQSPGSCPHGRPTMLMLSAAQLEREFGRHG